MVGYPLPKAARVRPHALRLATNDHWLPELARGCWGLMVPFPELVLEVGHVELVGELQVIQVRERRGSNSLHDALDTRIERAVHVGAHGKQALHVLDDVLG
jgi:hypothetical protein